MALTHSSSPSFTASKIVTFSTSPYCSYLYPFRHQPSTPRRRRIFTTASQVCVSHEIDKSSLVVNQTTSDDQLLAAACLRVRSFYKFQPSSYSIQDHKKYLVEREFEALKERVAGKKEGFKRVSCINATLPAAQLLEYGDDLYTECKLTSNGEDRVVVGSLDVNQCLWLPDEIVGTKPEGIGADFARAYPSNVCVAKELQRKGLGYELVAYSKIVAQEWGITDLYVHAAIDNEAAKLLYTKSGFVYESDEHAWQARFLDRPRRILLWLGLASLVNQEQKKLVYSVSNSSKILLCRAPKYRAWSFEFIAKHFKFLYHTVI